MIKRLPGDVLNIFRLFGGFDAELYLVGGSLRDLVLGKNPKDYDFATNLRPHDTMAKLSGMGFSVIGTGLKHGTITLVYNGNNYEITTYRIDYAYTNRRRPDAVGFASSLFQDLSRRDFTINALAYNPRTGIIDHFDGIKDINDKLVKAVGNPADRFNEDALRMLRAIRFSASLDFTVDKKTYDAIVLAKDGMKYLSKEKIRDELVKLLTSNNPRIGLTYLKDAGLMDFIIPELTAFFEYNQCTPYHDKDLFEHTICVVENTENDLVLRLAALLHDIAKPRCRTFDEKGHAHFYQHHKTGGGMTKDILSSLKFDNATVKRVSVLVYEHMTRFNPLPKNSTLKRMINRVGSENLDSLFKLQKADILASAPPHDITGISAVEQRCKDILNAKQPLSVKDLAVNGDDIMSLGIPRGPVIGNILNTMLKMVLEQPELNDKSILMKFVQEGYPCAK